MKKAQLEAKLIEAQPENSNLKHLLLDKTGIRSEHYRSRICEQCAYYHLVNTYPENYPGQCIKHATLKGFQLPTTMHACPEWMPY